MSWHCFPQWLYHFTLLAIMCKDLSLSMSFANPCYCLLFLIFVPVGERWYLVLVFICFSVIIVAIEHILHAYWPSVHSFVQILFPWLWVPLSIIFCKSHNILLSFSLVSAGGVRAMSGRDSSSHKNEKSPLNYLTSILSLSPVCTAFLRLFHHKRGQWIKLF